MEPADKKDYEIGFLAKTEEAAREVLKLIHQHQGEISSEGPLRRISLAYPIEKETHAHFGFLYVKLPPLSAKTLEHDLGTSQAVLRFLLVKLPSQKAVLAAAAKPRVARPGGPSARPAPETKPQFPLSNEALEKKIEEILQ